jgi:hypothetical protein
MGIFDRFRRPKPVVPVLSREAAFWAWFAANEAILWNFENDVDNVLEAVMDRIWRVNPALAFDFGPMRDGRREFVVTAAGRKAAFPAVVELTAAAPPLERWTVTAFRPRREIRGAMLLLCGDTLRLDEVRFAAEPVGGRLDVQLFIPGCRPTPFDEFDHVGDFLLDLAVGEFDAETRLAGVTVSPPQPEVESRPLAELATVLDALPGE